MDKIREQIAKIIGKELPWREEDLLEFADKIIKVTDALYKKKYLGMLPEKYNEPKDSSLIEERIAWTKGYDKAISECKQALLKVGEKNG